MNMLTMKNLYRALVISMCGIMISACSPDNSTSKDDFEKQVEDYIQKFPYQNTYDYAMQFTGGDAGKLNQWGQASRDLLKAGEDTIVRSNNDTLYKTAFVYLGDGPVVLRSDSGYHPRLMRCNDPPLTRSARGIPEFEVRRVKLLNSASMFSSP